MSDRSAGESVVLALVDHRDGTPRGAALELVTASRPLGRVEAAWVGEPPTPQALELLGQHGVRTVHHLVLPEGPAGLPVVVARALAQVVHEVGARTVALVSSFWAKETAAHLAHAMKSALMVDVSGLERTQDGHVMSTQQAFAASWTLRSEVTTPRTVVTLKPNAVPAQAVGGGPAQVHTHDGIDLPDLQGVEVLERTPRAGSDRPPLSEAQVVVVGGRGTQGDFSQVEELAEVLGGAVGATRVATDEGWIGHETQIGQTGVTVSPRLYIGAGVPGAVHHRGGMQSAGTIVAVNEDPEAPIFEIADFGVVGDLRTVLPQASAELRRLLG